jgi:hypothetical protein
MSITPKRVSDFLYYKPNMENYNVHQHIKQEFQHTPHHISHKLDLAWNTKFADRPVVMNAVVLQRTK